VGGKTIVCEVLYCSSPFEVGARQKDGRGFGPKERQGSLICPVKYPNGPMHKSAAPVVAKTHPPMPPMQMTLRPTRIDHRKTSSPISGGGAASGRPRQDHLRTFLCSKGEAPRMACVYDRGRVVWGDLQCGELELRCLVMA